MQSKSRAVMTVKHSLVVSAMRLSLLVWRVCLKGVIYLCLHSLQCCILVMLQCINDSSLVARGLLSACLYGITSHTPFSTPPTTVPISHPDSTSLEQIGSRPSYKISSSLPVSKSFV